MMYELALGLVCCTLNAISNWKASTLNNSPRIGFAASDMSYDLSGNLNPRPLIFI